MHHRFAASFCDKHIIQCLQPLEQCFTQRFDHVGLDVVGLEGIAHDVGPQNVLALKTEVELGDACRARRARRHALVEEAVVDDLLAEPDRQRDRPRVLGGQSAQVEPRRLRRLPQRCRLPQLPEVGERPALPPERRRRLDAVAWREGRVVIPDLSSCTDPSGYRQEEMTA